MKGRANLAEVLLTLGITPDRPPSQDSWNRLLQFLEHQFAKAQIPPQDSAVSSGADQTDENIKRHALYEHRFRVAFDGMRDLVWITNAQGAFSACNERFSQFVGIGRSSIIGRPWPKVVSVQSSEWLGVPREGMVPGAFGMHSCWARLRDDSGYAFLDTRVLPMLGEFGNFIGHVGIARDETKGRVDHPSAGETSIGNNLDEAQVQGVITKSLASELNGILAGVFGNLSFSKVSSAGNPALQKSLEQIEKSAMRAQNLVRQIEMFSQQDVPDLRPFAVESLIGRLHRFLRSGLPDGVVVDLDMKRTMPLLLADPKHVQQVISYVVHYSSQELQGQYGFVRMTVLPVQSPEPLLRGQGASAPQSLPRPMVRITVRAEPTSLSSGSPVGVSAFGTEVDSRSNLYSPLGLSYVRDLVRLNQGDLVVSKAAQGTSEIRLLFPTVPSNHPTKELQREVPLRRSTLARAPRQWPSVLYLDSDHLIVRFMERLGEQRGFHLRGFTSAEEALHALKLEPQSFNLMIVNSEMRSLRGVQIIAAAREVSSSLPIYLASAYIDESLLNQAREATATDVVFKNDIEGLVALIAKHDR